MEIGLFTLIYTLATFAVLIYSVNKNNLLKTLNLELKT